jgi:hypothetical protein
MTAAADDDDDAAAEVISQPYQRTIVAMAKAQPATPSPAAPAPASHCVLLAAVLL